MSVKIIEETFDVLPEYEKISIAFPVEKILRVELLENGLRGVNFVEEILETPFTKDYDAIEDNKPTDLTKHFDLSNWAIFSAFGGEKRIGGAIVARKTPEVFLLENRADLACLWDLRVEEKYRGRDVGKSLFEKAVDWAKSKNCHLLKVETQNINVAACRFYERQNCELGAINRFAYPESMNETQLIWYRKL